MTDAEKITAVKEIMMAYRKKMYNISLAEDRLSEARNDIEHPSLGGNGDGGGVHSSNISDTTAMPIYRLDICERILQSEIEAIEPETRLICEAMQKLPNTKGKMYTNLYYIGGLKVEDILNGDFSSKGAFWGQVNGTLLVLYEYLIQERTEANADGIEKTT